MPKPQVEASMKPVLIAAALALAAFGTHAQDKVIKFLEIFIL
jgi:hypothetical protein